MLFSQNLIHFTKQLPLQKPILVFFSISTFRYISATKDPIPFKFAPLSSVTHFAKQLPLQLPYKISSVYNLLNALHLKL